MNTPSVAFPDVYRTWGTWQSVQGRSPIQSRSWLCHCRGRDRVSPEQEVTTK